MAPTEYAGFQEALQAWFRATAKDYPWRRTQDGYAILVSEMMLQQTQVATVLGKGYFERWLQAFPTPAALAAAPEEQVLRLWEGLGYYNRARNLQKTAKIIVAEYGGVFPQDWATLRALPGLGDYTAGAVATFAYDQQVPIVDANIARVLARLYNFRSPIDEDAGKKQLWTWAGSLVPQRSPGQYNAALMELGQQICVNRQPACHACPVAGYCQGKNQAPGELPVKRSPRETVFLTEHTAWCVQGDRVLLAQESGKRRTGLWKLPEREEAYFTRRLSPQLYASNYTITHHRVKLLVYEVPGSEQQPLAGESWMPLLELPQLPMPSPYRKAVTSLRMGIY
jgi:A/G-specific adenine glycosylase